MKLAKKISSELPAGEKPLLSVIAGATGVGKTEVATALARRLGCAVFSADARQFYREIPIGTAAPMPGEIAGVPHYFIGCRSISTPYNAADYEHDLIAKLSELYADGAETAILCGGSTLYIDAVCRGLNKIPEPDRAVRKELYDRYHREGLAGIRAELAAVDPDYLARVDANNYRRIIHALEVFLCTGHPFTSFHTHKAAERPFRTACYVLFRSREELYARINRRVECMITAGLEAEARFVYPLRHLSTLDTVGYREFFAYFDGLISREEAICQIQRNSRILARRQMNRYRRDTGFIPIAAEDPAWAVEEILRDLRTRYRIPTGLN